MTRILVVEDEPGIALGLEDDLKLEGYQVEVVTDGRTALERARDGSFDLILLDIMLPGRDGFDVCRSLRGAGDETPIILLTAKTGESDKVVGLELGADDYVTKPFSPRELRARIKAHLRRTNPRPDCFKFGTVLVDFTRCEVRRNGVRVEVTPLELKLLQAFVKHPNQVLSRERLLDEVWGRGTALTDRVIDTHVTNLRKKIEPDPKNPRHLVSVRGFGYRFEADRDLDRSLT